MAEVLAVIQGDGSAEQVPASAPPLELHCGWTLWYDDSHSRVDWFAGLKPIITVNTVQDFWQLVNNMVWATEMKPTMTFYIFRQHIAPKWEDDINRNGGKFLWEFSKPPAELNGTWINLLLALVGETLSDEPEEIHGVVCQNRGHRGIKLQVWNRTASKAQHIRRKLEDVIGLSSKPYAAFSKKN